MGFYQDEIVPILINLTMRRRDLAAYRSRVVPSADGRVLEIGIGSGLNLPFYSRNVKDLIGLEPSPRLLSMVRRNLGSNTSEWTLPCAHVHARAREIIEEFRPGSDCVELDSSSLWCRSC
jgi:hypothetical protein